MLHRPTPKKWNLSSTSENFSVSTSSSSILLNCPCISLWPIHCYAKIVTIVIFIVVIISMGCTCSPTAQIVRVTNCHSAASHSLVGAQVPCPRVKSVTLSSHLHTLVQPHYTDLVKRHKTPVLGTLCTVYISESHAPPKRRTAVHKVLLALKTSDSLHKHRIGGKFHCQECLAYGRAAFWWCMGYSVL